MSRLGLLKAVHSSVEAEVGLAVVLVGQAVESQGHAASCDHLHPHRQEEDRPPLWHCLVWIGLVSCRGNAADQLFPTLTTRYLCNYLSSTSLGPQPRISVPPPDPCAAPVCVSFSFFQADPQAPPQEGRVQPHADLLPLTWGQVLVPTWLASACCSQSRQS